MYNYFKGLKMAKKFNKAIYQKRLREATRKNELREAFKGALAVIPFLLLPSIGRRYAPNWFSGWTGFTTATSLTWLTGVIFDIKALKYSAVAIGAIQLTYVKGAGIMSQSGFPVWRMGTEYATLPSTIITDQAITDPLLQGLSEDLQPGSQILATTTGKNWVSRYAPELEKTNNTINDYVTTPSLPPATPQVVSDYVTPSTKPASIRTIAGLRENKLFSNRI